MKIKTLNTLLLLFISFFISNCNSQKNVSFQPKVVYKSKNLIITQISKNAFEHTSFLQTESFGNVPCNGLIVRKNKETIVFDTPTNDLSSEELIKWINQELHSKINAIIPTHFHDDCLGGLKAFHNHKIPSYSYTKTIELAKMNNYEIPKNGFNDSIILKVGNENISAKYFGEGHTKDNIIGYFPSENIMFGGCLIKELGASKGYLGDANISTWSNTVEKVKKEYPDVKIIIPGHGEFGNSKLLDYTINLFKAE
ncbi:subclass B1 metallo-beta-lactamase [Elizabethkingia anophelis]|uniref:beta-lactamase n=4 Tax=Weeksellaceae TaxID=2762318 RepID=A0A383U2D5_9FLAO|nr:MULTISPECIES: subclass B1 metallo-beta-lactamase [Weeksellaceae]MBE9395636.1 subclass B1 metallo-beta-lactamase [Elizabethkingia anophelis]MBE9409079.1 subclass B1 metallo-beta-lactamase [Elizabethkingia anophelis]MCT3657281.1 subclass B1 metallo-beta-lactamase [Elizabethkingia anophelis]MCT3671566.1 subclass B1 metallo-beta-lactamase [Elizabethkingia anophelis]MCT3711495.1 subclass B1 metallo-beta-lactamase [Elizabethkingia anophelis]